jgi:hypothetical protein
MEGFGFCPRKQGIKVCWRLGKGGWRREDKQKGQDPKKAPCPFFQTAYHDEGRDYRATAIAT